MDKAENVFVDEKEFLDMSKFLETWIVDPQKIKQTFLKVMSKLRATEGTVLNFISRPGISYSLRASRKNCHEKKRALFALVDIIDDNPDRRWLSICFYEEMVTDPDELGNLVPNGILGVDGYCFDLYEDIPFFLSYVEHRIDEAHKFTSRLI